MVNISTHPDNIKGVFFFLTTFTSLIDKKQFPGGWMNRESIRGSIRSLSFAFSLVNSGESLHMKQQESASIASFVRPCYLGSITEIS